MTTNKPEVSVVYNLRTDEADKMVLLSEYEALQAECEQLRKDAARLDWLDAQNAPLQMGWKCGKAPAGNVNLRTAAQTDRSPTPIREAIDTAMQEGN